MSEVTESVDNVQEAISGDIALDRVVADSLIQLLIQNPTAQVIIKSYLAGKGVPTDTPYGLDAQIKLVAK